MARSKATVIIGWPAVQACTASSRAPAPGAPSPRSTAGSAWAISARVKSSKAMVCVMSKGLFTMSVTRSSARANPMRQKVSRARRGIRGAFVVQGPQRAQPLPPESQSEQRVDLVEKED